jgi:hypothetical protein
MSLEMGAFLAGPALMMAAHNLERAWLPAAIGEDEYRALLTRAALISDMRFAVMRALGAGCMIAGLGVMLMILSPDGALDWSYWIGYGVTVYGLILAIVRSRFLIRLSRSVRVRPDSA